MFLLKKDNLEVYKRIVYNINFEFTTETFNK